MKKCFDCGEIYLGLSDDDPCPNCGQNASHERGAAWIKHAVSFLVSLFGKVVIEFIWLLFSVSFGMSIVAYAAHVDLDPIIKQYGRWLVVVLFNAAMLRYVVAYALDWIDRELDKTAAQRRAQMDLIRSGFAMAVRMFKRSESDDAS